MSRKILYGTLGLAGIVITYFSLENWKENKVLEDERILKNAEKIAMSKDGNSFNFTEKENYQFFKDLGLKVNPSLMNEKGIATYSIDRTNFKSRIRIDFNHRNIGTVSIKDLEKYIEQNSN